MKKYFISAILFTVLSVAVQAQTVSKLKTSLGVDSTIVTNTGTGSLLITMSLKRAQSLQLNFVKTSGTLGGTVTLYGSNDGVNYTALTDATSSPTITTYTVLDAGTYGTPQSTLKFYGPHVMKYYKVTWAGTGTMLGYMKAYLNYD
jgi:hypothetical protein